MIDHHLTRAGMKGNTGFLPCPAMACFHEEDHTFLSLLKCCAKKKDMHRGASLHSEILRKGPLERNPYLGSSLISMYAKCGALSKARQVHDELRVRTLVSWNALISGYAQQGRGLDSLRCYEKMRGEGLCPDPITFTCLLSACAAAGALERGEAIHREIADVGLLEKNAVLGNALVDMYAKCGMLCKAERVHAQLPHRSAVSWNALIAGYAQHRRGREAMDGLERMRGEGHSPDVVTFTCILKVCGDMRDADRGEEIHEMVARKGFLERNLVLGNSLVSMYAKCGMLSKALQVVEELPARNASTWSSMISGYAEHGRGHEALHCFARMRCEGTPPNAITFTCIAKACGSVGATDEGKQIHREIVERGLLGKDMVLGSALVDMYAKCNLLSKAQEVHEGLHLRNIVSWSALISGYVEHGRAHEALDCYEQMRNEGLFANAVTFTCILNACGDIGALRKGKQIHDDIVRRGLLGTNVMLGNALVDMYAKCGVLAESEQALEELYVRNVVSWSALISGYAQQGRCHEALGCFKRMQSEGLSPDEVTFICILKACAGMAAIDEGKEIHVSIISRDLLEKDIILGTALVDMYAKCGAISKAKQVFEELPIRNIGSWSALMSGYAQRGQGHEALNCFRRMQGEGLSPDAITFVCLLSACGHSGLLDEAQAQFGNMSVNYRISPSLEHFTCMVMVFGYAGLFAEAMSVIRSMACSDYSSIWLALLAACKKWGNAKLGRFAFDHLIHLDVSCPTAYVLMADIYASAGLLEDVEEIEAMRSENIDLECNVNRADIYASANQQDDVEKIKALGSENTDLKCNVNLADDIYASAALLDDVQKIEAMGSENIDLKCDVNLLADIYASASQHDDVKKMKAVEPEISDLKHNVNILSINSSKYLLICFQLALPN